jgi:hypothetical protein
MGYSRRTSTTVKFSVSTKNDYFYKWITFAVKLDCKYKLSTVLLVCVRERRPGESVDEKKGERGLSLFFLFSFDVGYSLREGGLAGWALGLCWTSAFSTTSSQERVFLQV